MTSSSTHSDRVDRDALDAAVEEARAVEDSRNRRTAGTRAHLRPHSDTALAVAYLVVVGGWLAAAWPTGVEPWVLLCCIAAHAVASSIQFEIGPGSVLPTTPVLVACLFLVPPEFVPIVAIGGTLVSSSIERRRAHTAPERASVLIGSAVYALGPAVVFAVARVGAPRLADWPVYLLAAVAQITLDASASWFLNCYRLGVPFSQLVSAFRFAVLVDLLLFPIGYVIAFVAPGSVAGLLLFVPLLALLSLLQQDRTDQLDRAIALATRDPLTGLPNRTLFHERLDAALADGRELAVCLIDLDHFKEVNDTLGHAVGDELLVEVGRRLDPLLPSPDLVARLGGDEFGILVSEADADALCTRLDGLLAHIRQPFAIGELEVDIDASIGAAIADDPDLDAVALLRRADIAMYAAKDARAGRALYAPELDHYSPDRLALAGRLRRAIADGELALYYQPKIELATGRAVGVEALIRWQHPVRGLVPPDEFVPVAERTELIRPLTSFVFETAIAQAAAWQRDGRALQMSVNLSARNLAEDDLVESIDATLRRFALPPSALVVELTETTVMANPARSVEIMQRLQGLGVKISIDDFGTGHSSLAYLTTLPNDELKIDRSFVQAMTTDPNAATVVQAIIDLARSLHLEVVAEGIETDAEAEALQRMGCTTAQGYLFSRPVPAHHLETWLEARIPLTRV